MPHIVTDNCAGCRFTDCVTTCPVSCFRGDPERLYIEPDLCIDCGACVPACPVRAIYDIVDMPMQYRPWIEINAEKSRMLPVVDVKQPPMAEAYRRKTQLGF